jgi:hypothetical protein
MTRYEELCKLSAEHTKRHFGHREDCMTFAADLMKGLANYLGCPADALVYVKVSAELRMGDRLDSVMHSLPDMVSADEGFWYFAVQFFYRSSDGGPYFARHNALFGLKKRDTGYTLRFGKEVVLDPDKPEEIQHFYEQLFQDEKEYYSAPANRPACQFGFVPPRRSE